MIQAEILRELLSYDPETGIFRWLKNRTGGTKAGDIAGAVFVSGYRYIKVLGRPIAEHRLAWLYMTGEWPAHHIDHINRVKADNRFANLRHVTASQNNANRPPMNGRYLPGVAYRGYRLKKKPWEASIKVNRKYIYLGTFLTEGEAHAAYKNATASHFAEGLGP